MTLNVSEGTNAFKILQQASMENPCYRFQYLTYNIEHILQNDPVTPFIFSDNPKDLFRHNKNIEDTLVHRSWQQNSSEPNGQFPGNIGQCKTCSSNTVISVNSQFFFRHHFTCLSSNLLMYCTSCNKCCLLYIGETERSFRVRFGKYRRSVNNHDNTGQAY